MHSARTGPAARSVGRSTVLLVEADPHVREAWRARLSAAGVTVAVEADAEGALEAFAKLHPRRVVLGRTSGAADERLALLAEMAALDPRARVAVVVRDEDPAALSRSALRLGAFAVTGPGVEPLWQVVREMELEERAALPL